jgi:hypothetical protein
MMRDIRLGDDIDDFCVRCKRVMNHAVVSVISGAAAKVRCRTCHSDHDYRHEQAPPPKVDARKAALFQEVLKKVDPNAGAVVDDAEVPDVEIDGEVDVDADADILGEPAADVDADEVAAEAGAEDEPPPVVKAEPKAKAKAKGKTKK